MTIRPNKANRRWYNKLLLLNFISLASRGMYKYYAYILYNMHNPVYYIGYLKIKLNFFFYCLQLIRFITINHKLLWKYKWQKDRSSKLWILSKRRQRPRWESLIYIIPSLGYNRIFGVDALLSNVTRTMFVPPEPGAYTPRRSVNSAL